MPPPPIFRHAPAPPSMAPFVHTRRATDPRLPDTFPGWPSPSTTTMAYVPPALRKRAQGPVSDGKLGTTTEAAGSHENLPPDLAPPKSTARPTFPLADIHNHYWDPQSEGNGPSTSSSGTLNSSAQDPDKLKYIVLFHAANPRWQSHGIIFVKSKLYILPGGERFRDDPLSVGGGTHLEPSGKNEHQMSASIHDGETLEEEADVLANEVPSERSLVKENQVSKESQVSEEQDFGKIRQEHDEKEKPSEEIETKTRASTEPNEPTGTPSNDQAHDPETKDNRNHEPDPDPPYSPDLSPHETGPIAVFEQPRGGGRGGPFSFAGYHKIASLEYLAPHSRELVQLLEQKFTLTDRRGRVRQKQRSEESWRGSLKHRWAVIQMEKDHDADARLPPPEIEVREKPAGGADASSPRKSVNELLAEMRLKD